MSLNLAKEAINKVFENLHPDAVENLVFWINTEWNQENNKINAPYQRLRAIAKDIRTLIPFEGVLPTERIIQQPDEDDTPTLNVDCFLFDEDDVENLVEDGKIFRNYCKDCKSTNVAPLNIISHSISIEKMIILFKDLLPQLKEGDVVLDVGSRLGTILYGSYFCSGAGKIIGVEFNKELSNLQNYVVQKYGLQDRIQVVHNDICCVPEIVQMANVIILNNVFEYFLNKNQQTKTWQWLRKQITRPGTIVVTMPNIEDCLSKLNTEILISDWLKPVPVSDPVVLRKLQHDDFLYNISVYTVL